MSLTIYTNISLTVCAAVGAAVYAVVSAICPWPFIPIFLWPFVRPFVRLSVCPSVHASMRAFASLSFVYSCIDSLICSFIHSFEHLSKNSLHRHGRFGPKIVKIRAILVIFRLFEDFWKNFSPNKCLRSFLKLVRDLIGQVSKSSLSMST